MDISTFMVDEKFFQEEDLEELKQAEVWTPLDDDSVVGWRSAWLIR